MSTPTPRSGVSHPHADQPDAPDWVPDPGDGAAEWEVEGWAGHGPIADDEADLAARTYWQQQADAYQAEHGAFLAGRADRGTGGAVDRPDQAEGFVWGPEGVTEDDLSMLGPVSALVGRRTLEVGCGAAQCSAWLARRGVHAVGIDIAENQARHAPVLATGPGVPGSLHVLAASANALPFADRTFDAAFASYGAVQFVADLTHLLHEVHRVLRPAATWVFSVSHPIRWAFPDDAGPAGLTVSGSYFDRTPYVERDGAGRAEYAEFHRTVGDYVAAVRAVGFELEALVEPEWPAWNSAVWGGWSPLRGAHVPGTLIVGCRARG